MSVGVSYKGTTHFDPPSLKNYTKQPKSLSVEIFPSLMDEKKKGHETCHTSPSVMVEDSVHCWEYDILGKYVTEVPIPSSITEPMTSSTNFPDEVHLSIYRFHGNLAIQHNGDNMKRVHCSGMVLHGLPITLDDNGNRGEIRCNFDEFHQFPVTHFGDNSLEEAENNLWRTKRYLQDYQECG